MLQRAPRHGPPRTAAGRQGRWAPAADGETSGRSALTLTFVARRAPRRRVHRHGRASRGFRPGTGKGLLHRVRAVDGGAARTALAPDGRETRGRSRHPRRDMRGALRPVRVSDGGDPPAAEAGPADHRHPVLSSSRRSSRKSGCGHRVCGADRSAFALETCIERISTVGPKCDSGDAERASGGKAPARCNRRPAAKRSRPHPQGLDLRPSGCADPDDRVCRQRQEGLRDTIDRRCGHSHRRAT